MPGGSPPVCPHGTPPPWGSPARLGTACPPHAWPGNRRVRGVSLLCLRWPEAVQCLALASPGPGVQPRPLAALSPGGSFHGAEKGPSRGARLRARALRRRPLPTPSSCPLSLPKRQDVSSSGGTEPRPVREPLEAQVTGAALWTEQWLGVQRGVRHPTRKVDQENVLPLSFSKLLRASTLTEKNICVPCLEAEPTTEGVNEEAPVRIDNSH